MFTPRLHRRRERSASRTRTQVAARLLCAVWIMSSAGAAGAPPDDERSRAAVTLEHGKREAARYVLHAENESAPFVLKPESILKWQNTVNKNVHGNIFVWTKQGRPELIGSIFQFYTPREEFSAEFHSLSLTPLTVSKEGQTVWTPQSAGVVLQDCETGEPPAAERPRRLRQMRVLAEEFSGEVTVYTGETYRLRLLPQPLYRYEHTTGNLIDGALFAFVMTTDPDVCLLIEARQSNGGALRWQYGLARMHTGALRMQRGEREVWTAEKLAPPYFQMTAPYTLFKELPLPSPQDSSRP